MISRELLEPESTVFIDSNVPMYLIGAPHPHAFESKVPAEIAAQFTALSLVVQALLWALVGIGVGLLWPKFAPKPAN